jgi:hypothetical protein
VKSDCQYSFGSSAANRRYDDLGRLPGSGKAAPCVGEPFAEIREVHEIVRLAQQAGVEAVRPGVACQEIDRAARKVITDARYGERFISDRSWHRHHDPRTAVHDRG